MRKEYDKLWKGLLEEIFDDLLRFIFPEADRIFDMDRGFEHLDKELNELAPDPDRASHTLFVDKLVKAYRRDGNEEWLLIHVEIQDSTKKPTQFPERMFQYYYRIFDRYRKPMTAIAIFTAKDGHKIPDRYEYHFLGTHHVYQYNTLNITTPTNEELEKSNNPFAVVLLAARKALLTGKIPEKELLQQKLLLAKLLLSKKQFSHRKINMILFFLRHYIIFDNSEINRIFDKRIDEFTNKKNTMGLIERWAELRYEQGKEEMQLELQQKLQKVQQNLQKVQQKLQQNLQQKLQENNRHFVENLLTNTEFSMTKIASLANVSLYFVKKVKASLHQTA